MKNSTAFFNLSITGHHLEYLYHLSKNKRLLGETPICFIVNHGFKKLFQKTFGVDLDPEIQLIEITEKESKRIKTKYRALKYYQNFKILKKYLSRNKNIRTCYLMDIYPFLWFLCFMQVNTIIAAIYFIPIIKPGKNLFDELKIFVMKKSINTNRWLKIFILNNPRLAKTLNQQYRTEKLFESIVDPLLDIKSLNLPQENKIHTFNERISFLHIGSISERKGTLEILDAIEFLPEDLLAKIEFIIAGETTLKLAQKIQNKIDGIKITKNFEKLHFINKKLTYFEFDFLFSGCSYVLIPYLISNMSSGIVIHALNYNKPIIGPCEGNIGQIIKENEAGICVIPQSIHIAKAIKEMANTQFQINQKRRIEFLESNSALHFVQKIGSTIN
jgi:glycosyltransferase involved in cell wall biosynthesis